MAFCFILKHKITLFYLLSFVFIRFITRCQSLPFFVTRCHSLLLVVIHSHSLYHSLSLVVIRCHSLYQWLSLVVPIACLFINDLISNFKNYFYKAFTKLSFSTHFLLTLMCRLIYTCSRTIFLILSQNNVMILCAEETKYSAFV